MKQRTPKELEYLKTRNELGYKIIAQNIASEFTGKVELWFEDGYILDIKNNQHFGISIFNMNAVIYKNEQ